MNLNQKLETLALSAKYDASCASSGSNRTNVAEGIGHIKSCGICHSWSEDGRCISLLKILLTNQCVYDCAYCINRVTNDIPRTSFTPEEIAELTIQFYLRNYIEGLFLSSAVYKNPDYTMELIYQAVNLLRTRHRFNGYIHVKAMPGADPQLIRKTGMLVDRMSANIELPSQQSLSLLAPQKKKTAIFSVMKSISSTILEYKGNKSLVKPRSSYIPAGQSTQLIVGASPESDHTILNLSEALYNSFSLRRVYYSAYVPTTRADSRLPVAAPPLKREHRLYQADWLLRLYGFTAKELLTEKNPNFDPDLDPKCFWAICNMHLFPLEINKADYEMLLRVPGIGLRSAQRIIKARSIASLNFNDLKKMGVILKRARFFITCNGLHLEKKDYDVAIIKTLILDKPKQPLLPGPITYKTNDSQLLLFNSEMIPTPESQAMTLSGEL